jgi:hypothetical protein
MAGRDVYVGRLKDPNFQWDVYGTIANIPERLTPLFPLASWGPFWKLFERIENGYYVGKQVDWGAWAAKVSKDQILEFFDEMYSHDALALTGTPFPWIIESVDELRESLEALPDDELYVLIALES